MKKYSVFALYLFIGEAAVRLCGFYANAFLGRTLGPSGYGLIIIGSSLLTYSLLISDAGLRILGFVETAKPGAEQRFTFSDILNAKIALGTVSFTVLYGLTLLMYREPGVRTICIYFLFNVFFDALFLDWYFKGVQRFKTIAVARIIASIMYVISLTLFVKTGADTIKVPIFFFTANMISVVILFIMLTPSPALYTVTFSLKKCRAVITHSLPLGIGTLLNQVTVYLPPILLGMFADARETGYFGAALKIILLIMIIDRTFSTIFLSSMPRLWSGNKENAKKNLQTLLHCTIVTGFFISLMLSIVSETVITLVFGSDYRVSAFVLSLISWFFTLTMINSIFAYGLIAIDRKKDYLKATAIGFCINGVLITVLTYLYGKTGAATAVICGECVFVLLCYNAFRKFSALRFYIPFLKAAVVSACICYGAYTLTYHPVIKSIGAAVIFGIATFITQIITKEDITLLVSVWKKS